MPYSDQFASPPFGDRFVEVEHRRLAHAESTNEDDGPASPALPRPARALADLVTDLAPPEQPGALPINGGWSWVSALQPPS
jgi:hypothetical protein